MRRLFLGLGALIAAVGINGCQDTAPTQSAQHTTVNARLEQSRTLPAVRTIREVMLEMAHDDHAFAGFYHDDDGTLVVKTVGGPDADLSETKERLRALVRARVNLPAAARTRYERATVDYATLYAHLGQVRDALITTNLGAPFAVWIDVRSSTVDVEAAPGVAGRIRSALAQRGLLEHTRILVAAGTLAFARDADGVRPLLIEGEGGGGGSEPPSCSNNLRCRFSVNPASGIEIGREILVNFQPQSLACSVGFNAVLDAVVGELASVPASNRYLITASHCTSFFGFDGSFVLQNSQASSGNYALEVNDPTWFNEATGRFSRYSDASLLQVSRATTGASWRFGRVYVTPAVNNTSITAETQLRSAFGFGGYALGYWGAPVAKTGRTTGTSQGVFRDLCVDLMNVGDIDPSRNQPVDLLCQNRIELDSQGGDSGGTVWFTRDAGFGSPTAAGTIAACRRNTSGQCDRTKIYISDIAYIVQELSRFSNGTIRPVFVQPN